MARPKNKRRTVDCEMMGATLGKTACSLGMRLRRRSDFTPNDVDELCRDALLKCEFTIDPQGQDDAKGQKRMLDTDETIVLENVSVHSVALESGGDLFGLRLSIHGGDDAEKKLARLRYHKAKAKIVRVGDVGEREEPGDGEDKGQEDLALDDGEAAE